MESGAILDSWISASSEYSASLGTHLARLHLKRTASSYGGWAALYNDNNQWLQVDLQQTTRVTRIATQGREDWPQWVTEYNYSMVKMYTPSRFTGELEIMSTRYENLF